MSKTIRRNDGFNRKNLRKDDLPENHEEFYFIDQKIPEYDHSSHCKPGCGVCGNGPVNKRRFRSKPRRRDGKKIISKQLNEEF